MAYSYRNYNTNLLNFFLEGIAMALSVDSIIKLSTPQKAGILVLTAALVIGAYWYGLHAPQI